MLKHMKEVETIKILGIPIYSKNLVIAKEVILNSLSRDNLLISATGAHGLVFSKRNLDFKRILESFYLNLPDGMPGVWIGRLKGAKKMGRCYGPDFFMKTMKASSDSDITHYLCGGKDGVADKLKKVCEDDFGAAIVGTMSPPFLSIEDYDYQEIASKINASNANMVWIGLSTPKQEQFAYHLSKYTDVNFICCVGAAFDFHIGNVKQAPFWIQKIGMEWFFRLLMEPKRLWKRYFEIVPLFIYYNFAELLKGRFFK